LSETSVSTIDIDTEPVPIPVAPLPRIVQPTMVACVQVIPCVPQLRMLTRWSWGPFPPPWFRPAATAFWMITSVTEQGIDPQLMMLLPPAPPVPSMAGRPRRPRMWMVRSQVMLFSV
jgi:hypothetical protein